MNRSAMKMVCYDTNWSVMNVVFCDMVLLWTWSVVIWSVMNMVCCDLVCCEHGLLWTGLLPTGLLWTWSVTNVVCYEWSVTELDHYIKSVQLQLLLQVFQLGLHYNCCMLKISNCNHS